MALSCNENSYSSSAAHIEAKPSTLYVVTTVGSYASRAIVRHLGDSENIAVYV